MPTVMYYGKRFDEFQGLINGVETIIRTECLPPKGSVDVIVIDQATEAEAAVPIGCIGVVCSDNREGLQTLMKSGVRTVTCGMSYRDTVTLSSTYEQLSVCLQRRLPTVDGRVFEPAEFPVKFEDECTDCLLLASAVKLLCGFAP